MPFANIAVNPEQEFALETHYLHWLLKTKMANQKRRVGSARCCGISVIRTGEQGFSFHARSDKKEQLIARQKRGGMDFVADNPSHIYSRPSTVFVDESQGFLGRF